MTHHDSNADTPPAVETEAYEGPPATEQRTWIEGANLIILVLAVIFVVIIVIYLLTR